MLIFVGLIKHSELVSDDLTRLQDQYKSQVLSLHSSDLSRIETISGAASHKSVKLISSIIASATLLPVAYSAKRV